MNRIFSDPTVKKIGYSRMAMQALGFLFALLFTSLVGMAFAAQPAPGFSLPAINKAGEMKLSDFKGRVVYLDFWATWCPPCRKSFPWMKEMQQRYLAQGLSVVAISVDHKRELIEQFVKDIDPQAKDGKDVFEPAS